MAHSIPFPEGAQVRAESSAAVIPWYLRMAVAAVTLANVGGHWDISWHRSIGRDTFWTPAHIAIYLCGILSGLSCAYLILSTTFGKSSFPKEATVNIWGFRGPLGAFISAWGGIAMLTSAPFDDWWHSAYGLDVKILSPPHVLLIMGVLAIQTGTLILVLGEMNRAANEAAAKLNRIFVYVGGMMIVLLMVLLAEEMFRPFMHTARMYRTLTLAIPVLFAAIARASNIPWAATKAAGVYTLFCAAMVWILPLFPAEPKLGPVFNPVTHMVPLEFPLLLIVPAILVDIVYAKLAAMPKLLQAILAGMLFLAGLIGAQWYFAGFLQSEGARNWFFGAHYFDYNARPDSFYRQYKYLTAEKTTIEFYKTLGWALCFAIAGSRLGLAWGDWMRKVKR